MSNICKICGAEVAENSHYWLEHRVKESKYFETHYPRLNLLTNKPIPFKNRDSYFLNDFDDKNQLRDYLKSVSVEKQKEYCKELLIRRGRIKNIVYTPTQVELKSIMSPAIPFYNNLFGNYYELCAELGFKNKFNNITKETKIIEGSIFQDGEKYFIYQDSREQKGIDLDYPIQAAKLEYGDYCLSDIKLNNIHIERKSLSDCIGTVCAGLERFEREIQRCQNDNNYLVVLIEEKLNNLLAFDKLPWISKKVKATPSFVAHNIRYIIQKYPMVQFLAVDGRPEASRIIRKILFSGGYCKQIDLQLAYDIGVL